MFACSNKDARCICADAQCLREIRITLFGPLSFHRACLFDLLLDRFDFLLKAFIDLATVNIFIVIAQSLILANRLQSIAKCNGTLSIGQSFSVRTDL